MEKYLYPREGLLVRDPKTMDRLPVTGAVKTFIGPEGRYWRKRVRQGDCFIGNPPSKKTVKPEKKEKEE